MKAPDKIYIAQLWEKPSIEQTGFSPIWSDEVRPAFNNIAYIRKDALLEWAREQKKATEELIKEHPKDDSLWAEMHWYEQLIKHIESL